MEHAVGTEAVTALEFWTDPAGSVQLLAVGDAQVGGWVVGGRCGMVVSRNFCRNQGFGRDQSLGCDQGCRCLRSASRHPIARACTRVRVAGLDPLLRKNHPLPCACLAPSIPFSLPRQGTLHILEIPRSLRVARQAASHVKARTRSQSHTTHLHIEKPLDAVSASVSVAVAIYKPPPFLSYSARRAHLGMQRKR
jgi:hypothetical protein